MEEMICTGPAGTLACLWEKAAEEGPCPLVVCLAGGQEEGKRALAQLAARAKGAAVAAVPVEGAQEGDLADLFWSLRSGFSSSISSAPPNPDQLRNSPSASSRER